MWIILWIFDADIEIFIYLIRGKADIFINYALVMQSSVHIS